MNLFGVKIEHDFDLVEDIQTLMFAQNIGNKPERVQLYDGQITLPAPKSLMFSNDPWVGNTCNSTPSFAARFLMSWAI